MRLTFIGHQSWMIEHGSTCVLLDPVLADRFGHCPDVDFQVFPPRKVDVERMPEVHAVFLSHEHLDHFHLPSLARLDRKTPIYVSHLMPACVTDAIAGLGFACHRAAPLVPVRIGELEIVLYPAGRQTVFWEKRVAQFHVIAPDDPAGVYIAVDADISEDFRQAITSNAILPPRAYVVSNNSQIVPAGARGAYSNLLSAASRHNQPMAGLQLLHTLLVSYLHDLPRPREIILCGNGFLNADEAFGPFLFSDHRRLATLAQQLTLEEKIFGPYPGETIVLDETAHSEPSSWVTPDEPRHAALIQRQQDFLKKPTRTPLSCLRGAFASAAEAKAAQHRIEAELPVLARMLMMQPVGGNSVHVNRYLSGPLDGRRLLLRFLDGPDGAPLHYALDLTTGTFVVDDTPLELVLKRFPFGLECHLHDFAAMLNGDLQIWELMGNAVRTWWIGGDYENIVVALFGCYGEQVRPDLAKRVYDRALARLEHAA